MIFNVNHKVKVRLTDHGRELHRANYISLFGHWPEKSRPEYILPVEDDNGWSTWQLHSLMNEFGRHMIMGCPVPFGTNIEIIEGQ
jgi:hypothetical protein